MSGQQYPPQNVIAVDVDGTLHRGGIANMALIEWCRKKRAQGFDLMLWSARGEAHAKKAAGLFGVSDLFSTICSKPGYIVDDKGWSWIKFTRIVRTLDEA